MTARTLALTISLLVTCPFGLCQAQQNQPVNDGDTNVVAFEELQYPSLARSARIQGVAVVKVKLDDKGKVLEATAISGHPLLITFSVENVKKWVFQPNASKTAVIVYDYKIIDGTCNGSSSLFVLQGRNVATVLTCPAQVNVTSSH